MAVSIDWATKIITVNQVDMVLIDPSPLTYQHDLDVFRLELKDLEDDEEGIPFETTHSHNLPVTVGGAILARVIQFINGYTVSYEETGTAYRVNSVGANSNLSEVINTNSGEVSVSTSNSAGLQDLNSLQAASYAGAISVKTTSGFTGTTFPVGTRGFPVDNLADAVLIGLARGINTITCLNSLTITTGDFSNGFIFNSDNFQVVTITVQAGSNVTNCVFENVNITGSLDNLNVLTRCMVSDITQLSGEILDCWIDGDITLAGNTAAVISNCVSAHAGVGPTDLPTIDMGGSGQSLALRNYTGGIKIINSTDNADTSSLDFISGRVEIASSCTGGEYTIRGIVEVTDNSAGATVDDQSESSKLDVIDRRTKYIQAEV